MFLGNHITIETLVIIDSLHPYLNNWKQNLGKLFEDDIRRIIKVKPFVKFDSKKIKPIFVEFSEEN
jgi:hypothetical protein